MSRHRAQKPRLSWWQWKQLLTHRVHSWRLQWRDLREDVREAIAQVKAGDY